MNKDYLGFCTSFECSTVFQPLFHQLLLSVREKVGILLLNFSLLLDQFYYYVVCLVLLASCDSNDVYHSVQKIIARTNNRRSFLLFCIRSQTKKEEKKAEWKQNRKETRNKESRKHSKAKNIQGPKIE